MSEIVSSNPLTEQATAMAQGMPNVLRSISDIADVYSRMKAVRAAGKVAEGILELLEVYAHDQPAISDVIFIPAEQGGATEAGPEVQREAPVAVAVPVTGTIRLGDELVQDKSTTDVMTGPADPELKEKEIVLAEGENRPQQIAELYQYLDDFKGNRRAVVTWFLDNFGRPGKPGDLHVLWPGGNKDAAKSGIGNSIRQMRDHPVLGKLVRQSGSRASLRYWLENPQVQNAKESDVSDDASEKMSDAIQEGVAEAEVAIRAVASHAVPYASRSAAQTAQIAPSFRPSPSQMRPRAKHSLQQVDELFRNGTAKETVLSDAGLSIKEAHGLRRLYWGETQLFVTSKSAMNTIEAVALHPQGIAFEDLRQLLMAADGERIEPEAIMRNLEYVAKIFKDNGVEIWSDGIEEREDGDRVRMIRLSGAVERDRSEWPDFLVRAIPA